MAQLIFTTKLSELFEERAPWTQAQCDLWASSQSIIKPYQTLLDRVNIATGNLRRQGIPIALETYGQTLAYNQQYDLTKAVIGNLNNNKDTIILTGGVHGYEPSGEESCIRFVEDFDTKLLDQFNFVIYACITPSAYVTHHRWNNFANDQNRAFNLSMLTSGNSEDIKRNQEAVLFMQDIIGMIETGVKIVTCVDAHETPKDDIELRIARAERYGSKLSKNYQELPDGSYFYIGAETQTIENKILIPAFATSASHAMGRVIPMAQDDYIIGSKNHDYGIAISNTKNTLRHFMAQAMIGNDSISITTEVCPESIVGSPSQIKEKAIKAQRAVQNSVIQHLSAAA